jgi:hypothetical protein
MGDGSRGWQASFDWLIANSRNVLKVLEGEYAAHGRAGAGKSRAPKGSGRLIFIPARGPRPADCGVRVNPAALARIRAREAQRAGNYGHAVVRGGVAPQSGDLTAAQVPDLAPKPLAFDSQPRAAPVAR